MSRSVTFLAALLLAAGCEDSPRLEWGPCEPVRMKHVQLFGYYSGSQYLAELSPYSNLVWGGPSALAQARAAGMKAIVDVQRVFRVSSPSPPSDAAIQAAWTAIADQLRPDVAALAALYPADEPYLNGSRARVPLPEVQRRLESAAALIHATEGFENAKVAVVFSDDALTWMSWRMAGNPAGYDWIGWDLYAISPSHASDRLELLLSLLRPEQRVLLVPDAFLWRSESNELGKLLERIAFYLAWAEDHPEVVAVTPFIYQSGSAWIGARDIPASRDRWKQIGQCILAASATP